MLRSRALLRPLASVSVRRVAAAPSGLARLPCGYGKSSSGDFRFMQSPLRSFSTASTPAETKEEKPPSLFEKYLGPKSCTGSPDMNRWLMAIPAFLTHCCIGSPYGWSAISGALTHELGFLTSAANDWSIAEATLPIQLVFAFQGLAAAIGGTWAMKVGPRAAIATAGLCFGGGVMVAAAGVHFHSLPLLYLGYGVLAGTGVGLAYTPPLQTLIGWFPDRKGLASGLALAGFGSGALVFNPSSSIIMQYFQKLPTYLGTTEEIRTNLINGKLFADVSGTLTEVIMATPADVAKVSEELAAGIYVVGTGTTGAMATLAICGIGCMTVMLGSAAVIRTAPQGYKPPGWEPPAVPAAAAGGGGEVSLAPSAIRAVAPNTVMRTPQFYQLGAMFTIMGAGGISLMAVAKPMMNEVFSSTLPTIVTAGFAMQYVNLLAVANLGGRLGWAALSDRLGRRLTFHLFTLGSIPLYAGIPYLIEQVVHTGAVAPLYIFAGSTFVAITIMGGTYSILPAYESDLFGSKYVGPVHGRMLLFSSVAALGGPSMMMYLRSKSEYAAIMDLLSKVDPQRFVERFGASIESAQDLIAAKTVTISKLMTIMPEGTIDPSPFVYNSTMYTMAGLMALATLSHALVRPVDAKYFEKPIQAELIEKASTLPAHTARMVTAMTPSMASHMIPAGVLSKRRAE